MVKRVRLSELPVEIQIAVSGMLASKQAYCTVITGQTKTVLCNNTILNGYDKIVPVGVYQQQGKEEEMIQRYNIVL